MSSSSRYPSSSRAPSRSHHSSRTPAAVDQPALSRSHYGSFSRAPAAVTPSSSGRSHWTSHSQAPTIRPEDSISCVGSSSRRYENQVVPYVPQGSRRPETSTSRATTSSRWYNTQIVEPAQPYSTSGSHRTDVSASFHYEPAAGRPVRWACFSSR